MEWFLGVCHAGERFEGQLGDGLFVSDITRLHEQPAAKTAALSMAAGFINRIPPFVWQDYGKRAAVQIPEPHAPVPPAPSQTAGSLAQAGR
jgi:hypothetical protein